MNFTEYCNKKGWRACGLNADWCIPAFAIHETTPCQGIIALDNEDDSYTVLASEFDDDGYITSTPIFTGDIIAFIGFCEKVFK